MRLSIARTLRNQRREMSADGWVGAVVYVEADQRIVSASGGDQLGARVPYPGCRYDCVARPERDERFPLQSAFGNQAGASGWTVLLNEREMQWMVLSG